MPKIYIFSGLGVDQRVFDKMNFDGFNVEFIDWILPLKSETIENYAKRISQRIIEKDVFLIGLSFGGMMAVEVAKIIPVKKVILIASAKTKFELPLMYRIAGKIRLHKMIPSVIFKWSNFLSRWIFGIQTKEEKVLFKNILKDTDTCFLRWAINEIVCWKNIEPPSNYMHIHGAKDRILPFHNCKVDHLIQNGGHFMTVNKAKEIEQIIRLEI